MGNSPLNEIRKMNPKLANPYFRREYRTKVRLKHKHSVADSIQEFRLRSENELKTAFSQVLNARTVPQAAPTAPQSTHPIDTPAADRPIDPTKIIWISTGFDAT
jgi:hypothetical protein